MPSGALSSRCRRVPGEQSRRVSRFGVLRAVATRGVRRRSGEWIKGVRLGPSGRGGDQDREGATKRQMLLAKPCHREIMDRFPLFA